MFTALFRLLLLSGPLLALQFHPAAASAATAPLHPSALYLDLSLSEARLRSALAEAFGTGLKQGFAAGRLYDGAVEYTLHWSLDMSRISPGLRQSGEAVLVELAAILNLSPSFALQRGAEKIYAKEGCGNTAVSLRIAVGIAVEHGQTRLLSQPIGVRFPGDYRCLYTRNVIGDIRNWFTKDTTKQVNVIPLMIAGIKAKMAYLSDQFESALAQLAGSDAVVRHLNRLLFKPRQVTPNVWLWAQVRQFSVSRVATATNSLQLQSRLSVLPQIGFGSISPGTQAQPPDATPADDRFHLPFDLIIPRNPAAVAAVESIEMSRPGYRFTAVSQYPGVVALQRFQADLSEDVVLLEGSPLRHAAMDRIAMEAPIDAVLEEIIDWLEHNTGVGSASGASVARLLGEVRRVAAVVAYFQRPRSIPLEPQGEMTLAEIRVDLEWVSLQGNQIRAGVLLSGKAALKLAL